MERRCTGITATAIAVLGMVAALLIPAQPVLAATAPPVPAKTNWFKWDTLTPAMTLAAAVPNGYCTVQGCWTVVSTTHATFRGGGWYGYYDAATRTSRTLGRMTLSYTVRLVGFRIDVSPYHAIASRRTKNITLTGQMQYLSDGYPSGNVASPLIYNPCGARAGEQACQWVGTYRNYQRVAKAVFMGQAIWRDPYASGTWNMWAKSPAMWRHRTLGYRFNSPIQVVPYRAGAGWRPA